MMHAQSTVKPLKTNLAPSQKPCRNGFETLPYRKAAA
jgi:hypothetical protein